MLKGLLTLAVVEEEHFSFHQVFEELRAGLIHGEAWLGSVRIEHWISGGILACSAVQFVCFVES